MAKENVDHGKLHILRGPDAHHGQGGFRLEGGAYVIVTQAFCPNGHSLMAQDDVPTFDGFPGISLLVSDGGTRGRVVLSPFHGDPSKVSEVEFREGANLDLMCPTCGVSLPKVATCGCGHEGILVEMFLTPECKDSHSILVCNIWGCRRSQVIDQFEMISEFLEKEE